MPSRAAAYERHRRYKKLRDGGMRPADAATEVGLAPGTSRYERWYLEQGGKPYISANDMRLSQPYPHQQRPDHPAAQGTEDGGVDQ